MIVQKQHLTSELIDDKPVVFLLAEEKTPFIDNLIAFFNNCSLDARLLLIESFADPAEALKQYKLIKKAEIYKFLVVGGFEKTFAKDSEFFLQVLGALERGFVEEGRFITIFFLLNYSSPIYPIDFNLTSFKDFWSGQRNFLNQALKAFPLAQFCLVEDMLDLSFDFNLKFNLFFSPFKKQFFLDGQNDFYWQSQEGFFVNFKNLFFQSKPSEKYLLRGQKIQNIEFLSKAKDLCSRYFLQEFSVLEMFLKPDEENYLLADFIKVYHSDKKISEILDKKIRQLPHSLDKELILDENSLRALETQKTAKKNPPKTSLPKKVEKLEKEPESSLELNKKTLVKKESEDNLNKNQKEGLEPEFKDNKNIDKSSNIDKKLHDIFRKEQKDRNEERFEKNLKGAKKIVKKSKYRRLSFYFGIFLASMGSLILILFSCFYFTQKLFEKDLLARMSSGLSTEETSRDAFVKRREYRFFKWQLENYGWLLGEEILSTPNNYWKIFEQLRKRELLLEELKNNTFQLYQAILKTDGDLSYDWSNFLLKKQELYKSEEELIALLEQLNPDILPEDQAKILTRYKSEKSKELRKQQRSILFLEALSEFLLSPARSNIVILIQDSSELRSSGGFLVSLVTLSFEKSHLLNWQVYDVAELDQRIYGDKEANEELKSLLVSDKLMLRDANWPVSFVDANSDIAWFIEQSLNLRPDLVLTLGSKEIHSFLEVLSPISIDVYEINQNNFFEELLRQENINFNSLVDALLKRLLEVSKEEIIYILAQLNLALENREIFLYSSNNQLFDVLKNNLWTGEILEVPCPGEFNKVGSECFTDGIYQLENNVGLNKVNRLITQQITHSLGISEKFIRHKRTIRLENLSRQNFWPEGNYQVYLKFYLPRNADLEKITLNGSLVDRSAYRWFEEKGRLVLAQKISVPILSTSTLEFVYLVPHQLTPPFSYVFLDQKQAGLFNKHTDYKVLFAEELVPSLIAPQAKYEDKVIEFSNNNQDNFLFAVAF